ncbi:MAG: DNA-binding protein, partial [Candidatus Omnitrophota bacterium]
MSRYISKEFWFFVLLFVLGILNFNCYAEPVSSTELIENAKSYDGQQVVYEGEVIGEVMHRRDGVWVNINDGDNS